MSLGSRMKAFKQGRRGSLLIEVLLSVVILSTALTFMVQAMTSSLQALHYGPGYTTALILLDNQMCELLRQGTVTSGFSESKDLTESGTTYRYALRTEPQGAVTDQGVEQVGAVIKWRSGKKSNTIAVTTFLLTVSNE